VQDAPLVRSLRQLHDNPDVLKPPEAIIPRLAWRGRTSLIAAREKTGGKSTLLTAGAAAVTRGTDFLGEPCACGVVLWITADQEHEADIVQRADRFGADWDRFHVLWPRKGFADVIAPLDGLDPFPVLIVIDTLANYARVEDPHSSAEWPGILLPLVRLARDLPTAVAIPHHATKGENGGYRDSTAIGATVDVILELTPAAASPARRHIKALGRWPMPNFAVELVGDRYRLVAGTDLSLDAQVLAYVQQHPGSSQARVRAHIGGRAGDTDAAVGRLLVSGAMRDVGPKNRHEYVAKATPVAEAAGQEPDDPSF